MIRFNCSGKNVLSLFFFRGRGVINMRNILYTFYFVVVAIIALWTKEIVTFLMLGFVIIALHNINSTLKEILKSMKEKQ